MIISSKFKPAAGLTNQHIQTLLPTLLHRRNANCYHWQQLDLPDGDFVDLCWNEPPKSADQRPLVIVFHGLEGSIRSPYADHMMQAIKRRGWNGVLMHFRGCSGRANRLARSYHSGETGDAKYLIQHLQQQFSDAPMLAVGYSLGGNMLLKLQAELADSSPLSAAVSICAPIELASCADRIQLGFSKFYQWHLMRRLVRNLRRKFDQHDYSARIQLHKNKLKSLKSFWQFDDAFTAPIHGFGTARNYYRINSARSYLGEITKPTLMIQAADDPFMPAEVIPGESELGAGLTLEVSQYGGHVGFVSGSLFRPRYWLTDRVPEYLSQFL